jgi:hypothetical protein
MSSRGASILRTLATASSWATISSTIAANKHQVRYWPSRSSHLRSPPQSFRAHGLFLRPRRCSCVSDPESGYSACSTGKMVAGSSFPETRCRPVSVWAIEARHLRPPRFVRFVKSCKRPQSTASLITSSSVVAMAIPSIVLDEEYRPTKFTGGFRGQRELLQTAERSIASPYKTIMNAHASTRK